MANSLFVLSVFLIWLILLYHMFLMQGGFLHNVRYRFNVKKWERNVRWGTVTLPKVSILVPAHNEELVIDQTIRSMIELKYPRDKLEIIVVNDHSSDRTGEIAEYYAAHYHKVKAVHTSPPFAGKGKSSALNYGFRHATGDVIVVYDADNTPKRDAVYNLVLALQNDPQAGAVIGKFRVINAKKNLLTRFINIETICFQWMAQAGRWHWFNLATIPGTNFAIRRSILEELGGWDEKALSEDTELSIRVYNLGYHIRFFPEAVTWEQEPETFHTWWRQRIRWARGNLYVVMKYLFRIFKLKNKKVVFDLIYFFFTYFIFFAGIITSDVLLILNMSTDLELKSGPVSIVLVVLAYLLFVTEVVLALSMERGEMTVKNFFTVLFMYFTYCQLWIGLVVYAFYLEGKRVLFRQEIKWYKTERYNTEQSVRSG